MTSRHNAKKMVEVRRTISAREKKEILVRPQISCEFDTWMNTSNTFFFKLERAHSGHQKSQDTPLANLKPLMQHRQRTRALSPLRQRMDRFLRASSRNREKALPLLHAMVVIPAEPCCPCAGCGVGDCRKNACGSLDDLHPYHELRATETPSQLGQVILSSSGHDESDSILFDAAWNAAHRLVSVGAPIWRQLPTEPVKQR